MSELATKTSKLSKNLRFEYSPNLIDHYPFDPVKFPIRPGQLRMIAAIEEAYTTGKKFIIVEAPTGAGKSPVAIMAASWAKTRPAVRGFMPGAHILTTQKTLQAQYKDDFCQEEFGSYLSEIKGKSNYWCSEFDTDCDTASLLHAGREDEDAGDNRSMGSCCAYKAAKKQYIENPMGQTNFAFYLNETVYSGMLPNREMLVLDEGHNIEQQILGFTDTELTPKRVEEYGAGKLPLFRSGDNPEVRTWLMEKFVPATQEYMRNLEVLVEEAKYNHDRDDQIKFSKQLDHADKFLCRLNRFINSEDVKNWLCWSDKESGVLTVRPLTATLFANDILFRKANKVLIMSATILDFNTFMRNLGIDPKDAVCLQLPSDFPIENRPIFYMPVGLMSHKYIDKTLPKLNDRVVKICAKYNKKGIVHTHSYRITKEVTDFVASRGLGDRILTHKGDVQGSRDLAVAKHLSSSDPTILFSPSMTEGLDLNEDLSRFQIICKVPYPYMDPYVKARMERDPAWYQWLTALALVQETGRSIRSKTDRAHTYILDGSFEYFLRTNEKILPKSWTDSIIF